jgi:membrane protease YdiL (CAAX protease family)
MLLLLLYGPLILSSVYSSGIVQAHLPDRVLYLVIASYQAVILLGSGLPYWKRSSHAERGSLWLNPGRTWVVGISIGIITVAITALIHSAWGPFYQSGIARDMIANGNPDVGLVVLLMLMLAVTEEVVFRGYLLTQLLCWNGSAIRATTLQAAAFVAFHGMHQTPAGVADKFIFALILGYLANRTKTIMPGVIAHCCGNILLVSVDMISR